MCILYLADLSSLTTVLSPLPTALTTVLVFDAVSDIVCGLYSLRD